MKVPLIKSASLLHSHSGIYAINKPAGVRSHPNRPGIDSAALLPLPYDLDKEYYEDEDGQKWYLLNRLDSPTSGILLLSDQENIAKLVKEAFAERTVKKTYIALVYGRMATPKAFWKDHLVVKRLGNKVRGESGGNQEATTEVERIKSTQLVPVFSLLRLKPKTGRTHQLRVQCAKRRLPIIGDATYGDFNLNKRLAKSHGFKRLFLHSASIEFSISLHGKPLSFKADAPLPRYFESPFQ